MIVSVPHKELECKVKIKVQVQELGGHTFKDQTQIQTSSWWINQPGSVHTKFYSCCWLIQSIILLVSNNKGEEGGLINYLLLKREGLLEGDLFEKAGGLNKGLMLYNYLRKIQELFQPDIARKIRIFSLGRKNNILVSKRVYRSRTYLSITPCATSSKTSSCLQSWSKTLLNLNVQKIIYTKLFHYFYYKLIHNIVPWN